jgi:hypothetical protein
VRGKHQPALLGRAGFDQHLLRLLQREDRLIELSGSQMRVHERSTPQQASTSTAKNLQDAEPVDFVAVARNLVVEKLLGALLAAFDVFNRSLEVAKRHNEVRRVS